MTATTPKKIGNRILKFLKRAHLNSNPQYLELMQSDSSYAPKFCLDNCFLDVKNNGGSVVYGWVIWENKKTRFIEAEFHAVVQRNGKLHDITPRADGEGKVLFILDKTKSAKLDNGEWETWDNIRLINGELQQTYKTSTKSELKI